MGGSTGVGLDWIGLHNIYKKGEGLRMACVDALPFIRA